jgi:hypothetical protein
MRKNIFIVAVFSILFSTSVFASEFCNGYHAGYEAGYKQESGKGYNPVFTPLCPLEPLRGFGSPKSDYEFGYVIGIRDGMVWKLHY